MEKLEKINKIVRNVLEKYPDTRSNDNILILRTLKEMNQNINKSLAEILLTTKVSFESITRARRKIQRENPELSDKETVVARSEEELKYEEYYGR